MMTPTAPFQAALYAEMLGRIKEHDTTVPYRRGNHFYYSRTEKGKQYPILCRKHGSLEAPEEITLDLNRLAEGHAFLALGAYAVSDDGRRRRRAPGTDRKSTRLNSSHRCISYAVFCLKKKKIKSAC